MTVRPVPGRNPARRRAAGATVLVTIAVSVLAACSGVPTSSVPQVISSVNQAPTVAPQPLSSPPADADPRRIVRDFLDANVSQDSTHAQARQYLTAEEAGGWKDTTVTVITEPQFAASVDGSDQLTVTASKVGSVNADGQYAPVTGSSRPTPFSFGMRKVNGQWRIDNLPVDGLLVDSQQFRVKYQAARLYFFNQSESRLVPDVRYFAQTQQTLATTLLEQLINGPQAYLAPAVRNEIPGDIANKRSSIALGADGNPATVQLPGISQQDPATIARIAMQLAWTMEPVLAGGAMQIRDGSRVLSVNGASQFSRTDFTSVDPAPDAAVSAPLYYLSGEGGLVRDDADRSVPVSGFSVAHVASVAVASAPDTRDGLRVAAVSDDPDRGLRLGTLPGLLYPVPGLPSGELSRPDWAPESDGDVWLGAGARVVRVSSTRIVRAVPLVFAAGAPRVEQVLAVRFSPDGSRIALVLRASGATSAPTTAVWVGAVAQSAGSTRVEGLHQVTPDAWQVGDVAWEEVTTLMAVGRGVSDSSGRVWVVQDDGWLPLPVSLAELPPGVPDAVAAAPAALPVVVTNGTLWRLIGSSGWSELDGRGQVVGSAPSYRS